MAYNDKANLFELLSAAWGNKRAKKILAKVEAYKAKHPKKAFSFVFAEDGSFKAIEKKNEESNSNN